MKKIRLRKHCNNYFPTVFSVRNLVFTVCFEKQDLRKYVLTFVEFYCQVHQHLSPTCSMVTGIDCTNVPVREARAKDAGLFAAVDAAVCKYILVKININFIYVSYIQKQLIKTYEYFLCIILEMDSQL